MKVDIFIETKISVNRLMANTPIYDPHAYDSHGLLGFGMSEVDESTFNAIKYARAGVEVKLNKDTTDTVLKHHGQVEFKACEISVMDEYIINGKVYQFKTRYNSNTRKMELVLHNERDRVELNPAVGVDDRTEEVLRQYRLYKVECLKIKKEKEVALKKKKERLAVIEQAKQEILKEKREEDILKFLKNKPHETKWSKIKRILKGEVI